MDYLASFLPAPNTEDTPVKALSFVEPGAVPSFSYRKIPSGPIKAGHVLVKMRAAALNPIDIKINNAHIMWTVPGEKGLGRDFCGIVEQVGKGITGFDVGDRVCGMYHRIGGYGTIASHILVNVTSDAIVKAPDSLTDEEAASWPLVFGAAWQAVHRASLDNNSRCIVLGGSTATGIYTIQLLKRVFDVKYVVATCSEPSAELVKSLGADEVIDYKSANVADTLVQMACGKSIGGDVQETHDKNSAKGKFRLIVDCVGGVDVYNQYKGILELPRASGSAYVTFVGDLPTSPDTLGSVAAYSYNPKMVGRKLFGGAMGVNYYIETVSAGAWIKEGAKLLDAGKLKPVVDRTANWKEWKTLWTKQRDQKAHGKLVLQIDDF